MAKFARTSIFARLIRPFVWCVLGCIALIVLTGCMLVVHETDLGVHLLMTGLTAALMFVLLTGATVVCAFRKPACIIMFPAVIVVVLGIVGLLQLIWLDDVLDYRQEEDIASAAAIALIAAGAIIHTGVFSILPKTGVFLRIGKIITVGALWMNALFVISVLISPDFIEDTLFGSRSSQALGWTVMILQMVCLFTAGLGTVIVPLISVIAGRKQYRSEWLRRSTTIMMACPKCEHRQSLRQGGNHCANCKHPIRIELREPRCECGYLLFELKGSTCPECGRAVSFNAPMAPPIME